MPPTPPPKQNSLNNWVKKASGPMGNQTPKWNFEPGEVVTLSDSPKNAPKADLWSVFSSAKKKPCRESPLAKRKVEYTSEELLRKNGFDAEVGKHIVYPSGEMVRSFELSILKTCLSVNTSICLPGMVSPINIIVLSFINFKKWFPSCYTVFCYNTPEAVEMFKNTCMTNGIDERRISVFPTFSDYKKKNSDDLGSYIAVSPNTLQKIVESNDAILPNIRCIAVSMDLGETPAKFTKFVGPLVGKGYLFRILITTPSRPNKSRKIEPISTRQKTITSMFISEWEEPLATERTFRLGVVPAGISPLYWKTLNLPDQIVELLNMWKRGAKQFLDELKEAVTLPSDNLNDLINIDWTELQTQAEATIPGLYQKCRLCSFLVEAFRHLLLNGQRTFFLFCTDVINDTSASSLSEQVQTAMITSELLHKTFEETKKDCDPYQLEKFLIMKTTIENFLRIEQPIRGVILCESHQVSRAVCEALSTLKQVKLVLGIPNSMAMTAMDNVFIRHFKNLSGVFIESKNIILVMSLEEEAAFSVLDTACSNDLHFVISMGRRAICMAEFHTRDHIAILCEKHEQLRVFDGRLLQQTEEMTDKEVHNMMTGAEGSVNRYSFKFEPSRMAINVEDRKVRFVKFYRGLEKPPPVPKKSSSSRKRSRKDSSVEEKGADPPPPTPASRKPTSVARKKSEEQRPRPTKDVTPTIYSRLSRPQKEEYENLEDTARMRAYDRAVEKIDRIFQL